MKNKFLITGILLSLLLFVSIIFNPLDDTSTILNISNTENNALELNLVNNTGCCSVILHVQSGHDIVSYRRDSGYAANIIIENMSFNGQNAIHEFKTQNGYFTHTIITGNGWIISIGGKDNPKINKELEKLGSNIISKGKIENSDIMKANVIIKINGLGHFLIKSPDNNIGITAYDSINSSAKSSNMIKLFKIKDGEYVKVPNNPQYYDFGQFNKFSNDPLEAAIKIIGTDPYNNHGMDRRDVITYDIKDNNYSKKVDIWASFDGGTLLSGAKGNPDNIKFYGNKIQGNSLPKIPNKIFLGEKILQKDNQSSNSSESSMNLKILVICIILGIGYSIFRLTKK